MTEIRTVEEDKKRLEELEELWSANMKTKDKAGGNSGDNQEMLEIRSRLKTVK